MNAPVRRDLTPHVVGRQGHVRVGDRLILKQGYIGFQMLCMASGSFVQEVLYLVNRVQVCISQISEGFQVYKSSTLCLDEFLDDVHKIWAIVFCFTRVALVTVGLRMSRFGEQVDELISPWSFGALAADCGGRSGSGGSFRFRPASISSRPSADILPDSENLSLTISVEEECNELQLSERLESEQKTI